VSGKRNSRPQLQAAISHAKAIGVNPASFLRQAMQIGIPQIPKRGLSIYEQTGSSRGWAADSERVIAKAQRGTVG
jgi:hypothetical protein